MNKKKEDRLKANELKSIIHRQYIDFYKSYSPVENGDITHPCEANYAYANSYLNLHIIEDVFQRERIEKAKMKKNMKQF